MTNLCLSGFLSCVGQDSVKLSVSLQQHPPTHSDLFLLLLLSQRILLYEQFLKPNQQKKQTLGWGPKVSVCLSEANQEFFALHAAAWYHETIQSNGESQDKCMICMWKHVRLS